MKGITVIAGAARAGKTGRVVALFEAARERGERAQVIVPDELAARALKRRLLGSLPALEGECVTTFGALASRIARAGGADARAASAFARETILREAAEALAGEGRLERLSAIADFPGFYGDLESFLRQLEAACISSKAFSARAKNGSAVDKELALLYARYEAGLADKGLVDGEGLMRLAAETLAQGCPFRVPAFLGVDGFTHFEQVQYELLTGYARHVPSVAVTLTLERGGRAELFERTAETLKRLESLFAVCVERMGAVEPKGASGHIAKAFLSQDGGKAEAGEGLRVITTAGARMEAEEIAREAKRLIRSGRAPRDIAVAARDEATYGPLLEEAFSRMGVPLDARGALAPEGAAVFALPRLLVEAAETDLAREPVVRLLTSSYVDIRRLAGGMLSAADVMRIAREAAVLKGSKQWRARLEAYKRRTERAAGAEGIFEDEERAALPPVDSTRVDMLRAAVDHLAASLAPLRRAALPAVWAGHFKRLLDELGVRAKILDASAPEEVVFRDLAAYGALVEALEYLEAADGGVPTGAGAFLEMVKRIVRASGASRGTLRNGGVALVETARFAASYPVVFLCGVSSKAYPSRPKAGPFHCREEKERMAGEGLCESEGAHLAAERLVFYGAATRAQERLYVTRPATDEAGKPGLASFYIDEVEGLFVDVEHVEHGPSRLLTALDDAACACEALVAAGCAAGAAKTSAKALGIIGMGTAADGSFVGALRGAAVEAHREALVEYDRFDGRLSEEAAALVAERFRAGKPWSGTQLSEYGRCPWEFFLTRVLCATRLDEPEAVATALTRGDIAHKALARAFAAVRDRGLTAALYDAERTGEIEDVLDEAATAVQAGYAKRYGLGDDPFWAIESERGRAMLRAFLGNELSRLWKAREKDMTYVPAFFELGFGVGSMGDEDEVDASSAGAAVEVEHGGHVERLRGKIDRVDYAAEEADGPRPVAIIDYKLSKIPAGDEVDGYIDMQAAAYLYAAAKVVPHKGGVVPIAAFYRGIKSDDGRKACIDCVDAAGYARWRTVFEAALLERARRVRAGEFAPAPPLRCMEYCAGRGICRHNEARQEFLEEHG